MKTTTIIFGLLFASQIGWAQAPCNEVGHVSVNASGGEAIGADGSASYSLGQVFFNEDSNGNGSQNQGIQQLLENASTEMAILSTVPAGRNGEGTVELTATPNLGTVNWYDASEGGNLLGTGLSFTTPSINTTTTFYAEAVSCTFTSASRVAVNASVFNIPNSKVKSTQCGVTIPALNTRIYLDAVSGAQAYKVEVIYAGKSRTVEVTTAYFNFTQIAGNTFYTAAYEVRVAVKKFDTWGDFGTICLVTTPLLAPTTKLSVSSCGITLTSLATNLYAGAIAGAQGYQFEVTDLLGGVRTYNATSNKFNLTQLSGSLNNTTYSIKVSVKTNDVYGPFGVACNVNTPIVATSTKVRASQCGANLATISTKIYADPVAGAAGYKFEVVNGENTRTFTTTNNYFNLYQMGGYAFNTNYTIRVAFLSGGIYSDYGTSCNVTSPIAREGDLEPMETFDFIVASFPNPFDDSFKLDFRSPSNNEVNVMVYDMIGKQIENRSFNALEVYNQEFGANYAAGVYNIVVSQNETIKTIRVIKK